MQGKESRHQEPRRARKEQVPEHPGPDPVHPEASKPVAGKTPDELRRAQERRKTRDQDDAG